MRYVVGFGRFWWDFFVGDSLALAMGVILILALGIGLEKAGNPWFEQVLLPITVVGVLVLSLRSR